MALALSAAPTVFIFFLVIKITAKFLGVYPVARRFGAVNNEAVYTSLLMSTGLTFGTIAALFGRHTGLLLRANIQAWWRLSSEPRSSRRLSRTDFFCPVTFGLKTKSEESK